jgi:hypothetical protein
MKSRSIKPKPYWLDVPINAAEGNIPSRPTVGLTSNGVLLSPEAIPTRIKVLVPES